MTAAGTKYQPPGFYAPSRRDRLWTADAGIVASDDFVDGSIAGAWSWINQGSFTATEANGALTIQGAGVAGMNARGMVRSLTGITGAYVATFKLGVLCNATASNGAGVLVRNSSTGGMGSLALAHSGLLSVDTWTSTTVYGSNVATVNPWDAACFPLYMRVTRAAGGTYSFAFGPDGYSWQTVSTGYTITADQIGIFAYANVTSNPTVGVACYWFQLVQ